MTRFMTRAASFMRSRVIGVARGQLPVDFRFFWGPVSAGEEGRVFLTLRIHPKPSHEKYELGILAHAGRPLHCKRKALVAWTTDHGFASLAVNGRIRGKGCTLSLADLADISQIHTVEARLKKEFACGNF